GADIGIHSVALAAWMGSNGHLIVYESRPLHKRLLQQNLAANRAPNVTIMRGNLGGRDVGNASGASSTENIDQLALERLDLLKINSGSSAMDVIGGANDSFWRLRPLLLVSGLDNADLRPLADVV